MEIGAQCVFMCGNFKVICTRIDDVRHQYRTQLAHDGADKWHVDLRNMKVDNWEDADALVHQFVCLINCIKDGKENGTL